MNRVEGVKAMQVTTNTVRHAIMDVLETAFPSIPIAEGKAQEEMESYFDVVLTETTHTEELTRRFMRSYQFDIRYVASDQQVDVIYDVADQMTEALSRIELGMRPVQGKEMRVQLIEGVLHFYVKYDIHVWSPAPNVESMQTLRTQEGLV